MEHQRPHGKPKGVEEREVVAIATALVRVFLPLHGAEAADDEKGDADDDVGDGDADPDLDGQRLHEGEDTRALMLRLLDDDGHPDVHEGLGEVDVALALGCDGQARDGQVRLLQHTTLLSLTPLQAPIAGVVLMVNNVCLDIYHLTDKKLQQTTLWVSLV